MYLIKFLSLDLAIWSIYLETGESCCLKWSFSLTLSEIPWRFSSILPNVKISLTLCKIPWQFPDLEKFYFSLTFPWRLWTLWTNVDPDGVTIMLELHGCWTPFRRNGVRNDFCDWFASIFVTGSQRWTGVGSIIDRWKWWIWPITGTCTL